MTFEIKIKEYLEDNGMFPENSKAVFEAMKSTKENEAMSQRWYDDPSDYPSIILRLAIISARHYALIWIDENCPDAWYRPLFTGEKVE